MFARIGAVLMAAVLSWMMISKSAVWSQENLFTIARLHYEGGGDWYSNQTSLPNLLKELRERLNINAALEETVVKPSDVELFEYPLVYMNGHGTVKFSQADIQNLRTYAERGGLLWADDNYGMDESFRQEIAKVFSDEPLREIPYNHPIFSIYYPFKNGLPKIHEHDGGPPLLYGIFHQGRIAVLYTFNTDIGDGLESEGVHPEDPPHVREQAMQMAINLILFAMSN